MNDRRTNIKIPRTPLGTYQLGKLIADIQERLRDYTSRGIPVELLKTYYNDAVNLLFLARLTERIEYKDNFTLPVIFNVLSNTQEGSGYDSDNRILTLIKGDTDNTKWTNCKGFSFNWLGANILLTDISIPENYPSMIIEYLGDEGNTTEVILSTSAPTIAYDDLVVLGNTNGSIEDDILSLTQYENYKRIYDIDKITSSTGGLCIGRPKVDVESFEGIKRTINKSYSNYANQIIYNRQGEILEFAKGVNLKSYGTRKIYVTLFPQAMESEDDYIDVPDIFKSDIDNIVLIKAVSTIPKEELITLPPQDVMGWYNDLEKDARAREIEKNK